MKQSAVALADIALFVEVAKTESFSRAAARLEIPVPTLSRRIAAMEKRLGIQLFQRTTRKVVLAQCARLYYERCLEVLTAADKAQAAIEPALQVKGNIRISMPVDLGVEVIGPILSGFLFAHPELSVELDLSSAATDLFLDPVDLAFRIGKTLDDRVVAKKIATIASGLYAAPSYLKRHGHPTQPVQLNEAHCLNLQTSTGVMPWEVGHQKWKQAPGLTRTAVNNISLLKILAEQGHGVALLPQISARESLKTGRLVRLLPKEQTTFWPVYAITSTRLISKDIRKLVAYVKDELCKRQDPEKKTGLPSEPVI